jgi:hypothetical protein
MSATDLNPMEKIALQAGNMLKVKITGQDSSGLFKVSLPLLTSSSFPSTNRKMKSEESKDKGKQSKPENNNNNRSSKDNNKSPSGPLQPPPNSILLNNLKSGFKLEGEIVYSNDKMAFVSAKIYRRARGGTFAEVNGFLKKEDAESLLGNYISIHQKEPLFERGEKITVYVKEVFKNAG